jgi:hypothetical protein
VAKTVLFRLFGFGKIPAPLLAQLKSEGILLLDEGIRGSVTYRQFRAPGKYFRWKRQWYTASIALTKERVLALRHSRPIVNVPVADQRIRELRFLHEDRSTLLVAFDASLFHEDWSGAIEYRFRTPQAQDFVDVLRARVG